MYNNIKLLSELNTFGRGRDKFKRKKKKDTLKGHAIKGAIAGTLAGAAIGGGTSLAKLALMKKLKISTGGIPPRIPAPISNAVLEGAKGAARGVIGGGIVYGAKKKLNKDK